MFNSDREFTSPDQAKRDTLRAASSYAHFAQNELFYANKAVGTWLDAYNWALADYLGRPEVVDIDISQWNGEVGEIIQIHARDNLMVFNVEVMIWEPGADAEVFESGEARQSKTDRSLWVYTTTTKVPHRSGVCVDVVAHDRPGNAGEGSAEVH